MAFLEIAQKRFSARKFKDIPVEKEKIVNVLENLEAIISWERYPG